MSRLRRALRLLPTRPEDMAVALLRLVLLAGVVWYLVHPVQLSYVPGPYLAAVTLAGVLGGAWIGAARATRPRLLRLAESAWLGLFLLHFLGHAADLYRWMPLYDTGVHFTGGLLGALVVLGVGGATRLLWDRPAPFRVAAAVLGLTALGGIAVELTEFYADRHLGTSEQSDPLQEGLVDTMVDLTASTLAALVVAVGGAAAFAQREPAPTGRSVSIGRPTRGNP